ncbi:VWA domain-containing protein [uncultured Meiothermus sp.]|jgi:Ca-activated chloride channel family protein|uniref:vWA domain-containing protein n=1 Tax=uncultured Meiothermus sp. TaxID=157471 RepID=UPI0026221279|nr:VWA domain-containing protein [uncultured Meiothermus sp.]
MLETRLQPHREYLMANMAGQKMFLALKVQPQAEAVGARPQLAIAFVVDTSGSMREVVTQPTHRTGQNVRIDGKDYEVVRGARSKMDLVVEALQNLLNSRQLQPTDRLALVKFDDYAGVVQPFTDAASKARLIAAAEQLTQFSGGTHMGAGMLEGMKQLNKESGSRRMLLLTDGQAFDEPLVEQAAQQLAEAHIPVTAIGVGDDWNDDLLTSITDRTQGKPFHIVPDTQNPLPPSLRASELPQAILGELENAANEVITNIALAVKTVRDVTLERVTRVYPTQSEVDLRSQPHPLGNAAKGDWTVFILEFTLPARPASRIRLAQMGLTYEVPGKGYRGEVPPMDIVVEFTTDETLTARIDPQVMHWVQQRNLEMLVKQATQEARTDPAKAARTLELARNLTVKLGNTAMTRALDQAVGELKSSKTIRIGTAKTIKIGAKTQVLKHQPEAAPGGGDLPSDEEIRKMTGA